jgi:hypothetical protein
LEEKPIYEPSRKYSWDKIESYDELTFAQPGESTTATGCPKHHTFHRPCHDIDPAPYYVNCPVCTGYVGPVCRGNCKLSRGW